MKPNTEARLAYDPAPLVRTVDGAPYLDRKHRLAWLRAADPSAEIDATLASAPSATTLIVRVAITTSAGAEASAYGSAAPEEAADPLALAEDRALGRALAFLGYGAEYAGELDEAPAPPPSAPPPASTPPPERPPLAAGTIDSGYSVRDALAEELSARQDAAPAAPDPAPEQAAPEPAPAEALGRRHAQLPEDAPITPEMVTWLMTATDHWKLSVRWTYDTLTSLFGDRTVAETAWPNRKRSAFEYLTVGQARQLRRAIEAEHARRTRTGRTAPTEA